MVVSAMKGGARDFIQKPFRGETIVSRLEELLRDCPPCSAEPRKVKLSSLNFPGRKPLSQREREVLGQIISGLSNKEAGSGLGISHRTVESHRARLMRKLGVRTPAELMRAALTGERV